LVSFLGVQVAPVVKFNLEIVAFRVEKVYCRDSCDVVHEELYLKNECRGSCRNEIDSLPASFEELLGEAVEYEGVCGEDRRMA